MRLGSKLLLYHQTSPDAAEAILETQKMMRGSKGVVGGGIYFAESPGDTHHKAQGRGVMLAAKVSVGRVKVLNVGPDKDYTFTSLHQEGFDSVLVRMRSGPEWVVYNYDQVQEVRPVQEP